MHRAFLLTLCLGVSYVIASDHPGGSIKHTTAAAARAYEIALPRIQGTSRLDQNKAVSRFLLLVVALTLSPSLSHVVDSAVIRPNPYHNSRWVFSLDAESPTTLQ
jgi:hypothetical protein